MAKKKATEKTARDSSVNSPAISPVKAEEDVKFCVWIGPGVRGVIQYGQIFRVPRERAREVCPRRWRLCGTMGQTLSSSDRSSFPPRGWLSGRKAPRCTSWPGQSL